MNSTRTLCGLILGAIFLTFLVGPVAGVGAATFGFNDNFSGPSKKLVKADNDLAIAMIQLNRAEYRRDQRAGEEASARSVRDQEQIRVANARSALDEAREARDRAYEDWQEAREQAQECRDLPVACGMSQSEADQAEADAKAAYERAKALVAQRNTQLENRRAALDTAQLLLDQAEQAHAASQVEVDQAADEKRQAELIRGSAFGSHLADLRATLDSAAAAGARVARFTIQWDQVERFPGQPDFGYYDLAYELMRDREIRPLILITGAPCWSHPSVPCGSSFKQGGNRSRYRSAAPEKPYLSAWRAHSESVVSRYPEAVGVEVWNEPNLKLYWGPKPRPAAYTKIFELAAAGAAEADPSMPIVFGGLSPDRSAAGMNWERFLEGAYRLKIGRHADALGLHPYTRKGQSTKDQLRIASKLQRRFDRRSKIWVTEYGKSSNRTRKSRKAQARSLVKALDFFEAKRVRLTLIHRLRFADNPNPWERGLSVLTPNGSPKPAYCALAKRNGQRPAPCRG